MKLDTFQEQLLFIQKRLKNLSAISVTAHPDNDDSFEIILNGKFFDLLNDISKLVEIIANTDNEKEFILLANIAFEVITSLEKSARHEIQKTLATLTSMHLLAIIEAKKK